MNKCDCVVVGLMSCFPKLRMESHAFDCLFYRTGDLYEIEKQSSLDDFKIQSSFNDILMLEIKCM